MSVDFFFGNSHRLHDASDLSTTSMFRKILVANRGEIAVRIMRTCRELGIPSVAVYSEPDRTALHTIYATEAYPIGPAPAKDSYLNIDRLIETAKKAQADAIHPGYGFLSERANFAQAVKDAGLVFIGPDPRAITTMGEKTLARRTMIAAKVPVVPGTEHPVETLEAARAEGRRIGFPLMLKAAAGGGGKGMRLVAEQDALEGAFDAARREALSAFGDGAIYLERYIVNPRHIEVQVFGDSTGRVIHVNERECSIQRRHQKVVEEAPSPAVDDELRARIGQVAVMAAKAVDYVGAGTVEFLLDEKKNFYFLEMNTRLQVEHPVTELTTGVDLVREQILVASGAPMELRTVAPRGHAIEVRIYAEDPDRGFIPCPGRISFLRSPGGFGVRTDAGVYAGAEVTPFYDPMISKLSVWAQDRERAIARMDRALSEYVVNGVTTNITFLRRVMQHQAFRDGAIDTGFINKHLHGGKRPAPEDRYVDVAMIAAAIRQYEYSRDLANRIATGSEERGASKWRLLGRRTTFHNRLGADEI